MILTFIIQFLCALIVWLVKWLPTGDLPTAITTGWNYLVGTLWSFDWLLPIDTLILLFILTISGELLIWGFDIGHWIYKKIRGTK